MGSHAERMERQTETQLARDWKRAEKGKTSTMSLLSTLTGQRTWTRPSFDQPMITSPRDLTPLGADRMGRQWFSHKKYGEMVELAMIDASRQDLPNSVIVEVDRDTFRHFGTPVEPGTLQRLMNTPGRVPTPPRPHRPVNGLGHLFLAAARPEMIVSSRAGFAVRSSEAPARGPAEILHRLARAGANVHLSTDNRDLVVETSGGSLGPGILELVDRAAPLLVAYLNGEPLSCTASPHKTPALAVTVGLGGAAICAECLDGAA